MISKVNGETKMVCREAKKRFPLFYANAGDTPERKAIGAHLETCARCSMEYRLYSLQMATLDAAASSETISPDENFFRGLRARIARGPEVVSFGRSSEEGWAGALLLTARQLIPAMALLILLMTGVTLFWNERPAKVDQAALRPRDRVVFSDMYDYPAPTRDDVLETLVALEEK